jgi:hypothetical protein
VTIKCGQKSRGTQTREWLRCRRPAAIVNDRPVLSSKKAPTSINPQLSESNKNLVLGPRWGLTPRLTGRRSHDFDLWVSSARDIPAEASGQSEMIASMRGPEPGSGGMSAVGSRYQATWLRTLVCAR